MATKQNLDRKQVLVAYDGTDASQLALERAIVFSHDDPLVDLHVVRVLPPLMEQVSGGVEERSLSTLEEMRKTTEDAIRNNIASVTLEVGRAPRGEVRVHARVGDPATAITELAAEIYADLILIGSHGRTGLARVLLGSVAESVSRNAGCSVHVVKPKMHPLPDKPADHLAPVDRAGKSDLHQRPDPEPSAPRNVQRQPNMPLLVPMDMT